MAFIRCRHVVQLKSFFLIATHALTSNYMFCRAFSLARPRSGPPSSSPPLSSQSLLPLALVAVPSSLSPFPLRHPKNTSSLMSSVTSCDNGTSSRNVSSCRSFSFRLPSAAFPSMILCAITIGTLPGLTSCTERIVGFKV